MSNYYQAAEKQHKNGYGHDRDLLGGFNLQLKLKWMFLSFNGDKTKKVITQCWSRN